jgi:hypothetical protein
MVDPGRGARCAIRDTGAPGGGRYHWTVTVFGETDPVAAGADWGDWGGIIAGRGRVFTCAENGGLASYMTGRQWLPITGAALLARADTR